MKISSPEHLLQLEGAKELKMFDYADQNPTIYGSPNPPVYNLSRITAGTYLYQGTADTLIDANVR